MQDDSDEGIARLFGKVNHFMNSASDNYDAAILTAVYELMTGMPILENEGLVMQLLTDEAVHIHLIR